MKELVGLCSLCGKELFCLDGFFNGVHTDDKRVICFECTEKTQSNAENPQT